MNIFSGIMRSSDGRLLRVHPEGTLAKQFVEKNCVPRVLMVLGILLIASVYLVVINKYQSISLTLLAVVFVGPSLKSLHFFDDQKLTVVPDGEVLTPAPAVFAVYSLSVAISLLLSITIICIVGWRILQFIITLSTT